MQQTLEKSGTRAALSEWSQWPKRLAQRVHTTCGLWQKWVNESERGPGLRNSCIRCHLYSRLAACLSFVCLGSASLGLALL